MVTFQDPALHTCNFPSCNSTRFLRIRWASWGQEALFSQGWVQPPLCPHTVIHSVFCHVWLCEPRDCNPPGSSIHRISQARIPECIAISFSKGSSEPRDQTHISYVPYIEGGFLTTSTTWETPPYSWSTINNCWDEFFPFKLRNQVLALMSMPRWSDSKVEENSGALSPVFGT